MFIYLAHPIDQAADGGFRRMIRQIVSTCAAQGVSLFRPGRAYALAPFYAQTKEGPVARPDPDHLRAIDQINQAALFESEAVIALLPPGVPTLGVPAEIERALVLNRPVLIVTTPEMAYASVQIQSWVRSGATARFMDEDGLWVGDVPRFVDALSSLPDPTRFVSDGVLQMDGPPDLLVTYAAGASPLRRAYVGDAGIDLAISTSVDLKPGEYKLVSTGIRCAVPSGYWGFMTGRSSAWMTHKLDVRTAVIDSSYRGELKIGLINRSDQDVHLTSGLRLAQYIIMPAFMGGVKEVDVLPDGVRGEAGYGSSGR